MRPIQHISTIGSVDVIDQLMSLNTWAHSNHDHATMVTVGQFKEQLHKLRSINLEPPVEPIINERTAISRHWISSAILRALEWQRRQIEARKDELTDLMKTCAANAQTRQAKYHYQRMCISCNNLCALTTQLIDLEAELSKQLLDLGAQEAANYLPSHPSMLH